MKKNNEVRNAAIFLIWYFLIASFTYGYVHREMTRGGHNEPEIGAFCLGILWPVYWPMHLSRAAWADKPVAQVEDSSPVTRLQWNTNR